MNAKWFPSRRLYVGPDFIAASMLPAPLVRWPYDYCRVLRRAGCTSRRVWESKEQ